jgi:hypothetical protein
MPITRTSPTTIPAVTYDEWYMTRFEVYPDPTGPWRASIEFVAARDTGETLLEDDGEPSLSGDGSERTIYELFRDESRRIEIADLNQLARDKAAAGDSRFLQALGLVLTLAAEHGQETGAID